MRGKRKNEKNEKGKKLNEIFYKKVETKKYTSFSYLKSHMLNLIKIRLDCVCVCMCVFHHSALSENYGI